MYRGRIRFKGPFIWVMGFIPAFVIGGLTGVLAHSAPADFVVHNSLFLVAHFHNVIISAKEHNSSSEAPCFLAAWSCFAPRAA